MRFLLLTALVTALGTSSGHAQDEPTPKKAPPTREQKLAAACQTMAGLSSLTFDTKQRTTNRVSPFVVRGMPKVKEPTFLTSGVWNRDLLKLEIGEVDRVIFRGRRMIASDDDTEWTFRRGKLADGSNLPFSLDPAILFANLLNMKCKVVHNSVGSIGGKPVEIYTIRVDEHDARTLLWSGSIPDDQGQGGAAVGMAGGGAVFLRAFGAGAGARGAKPDIFVDLAIAFDPATKQIHRIQGKSYTKGKAAIGGRVVIGGVGGGFRQQEEEEEEDEEEEEGGFDDDELPVHPRAVEKQSTIVKFTLNFYDHGKAKAPQLSKRARQLLGL